MTKKKIITLFTALSMALTVTSMAFADEVTEVTPADTAAEAAPTAEAQNQSEQTDNPVVISTTVDGKTMPTPPPDTYFDPNMVPTYSGDAPVNLPGTELVFEDVAPTAWYHDVIVRAYDMQLVSGMSETIFMPEGNVTGGQLIMMLFRAAGNPVGQATEGTPWYSYAVDWARDTGIIKDEGWTFDAEANLTREQMMVLLYNYKAYKHETDADGVDLSSYADSGEISDYARSAIEWLVAKNYIQGDGVKIRPLDSLTRAETCVILVGAASTPAKPATKAPATAPIQEPSPSPAPVPGETPLPGESPMPVETPIPSETLLPQDTLAPTAESASDTETPLSTPTAESENTQVK